MFDKLTDKQLLDEYRKYIFEGRDIKAEWYLSALKARKDKQTGSGYSGIEVSLYHRTYE